MFFSYMIFRLCGIQWHLVVRLEAATNEIPLELLSATVAANDARNCLVCLFWATVETWRCNMVDWI